jgi:RNA polymerase sigma factor (sigma-70 family)
LDELPMDPAEPAEVEDRISLCLQLALDTFPAAESELLRAAYIDERPLQELADEAGQTYKAIESRLGRLRQKLKTSLLNFLRHEKNL